MRDRMKECKRGKPFIKIDFEVEISSEMMVMGWPLLKRKTINCTNDI